MKETFFGAGLPPDMIAAQAAERTEPMLYLTPFITLYCCALAALLGACMGSFLNCLAWRTVHGESIVCGHSHCDKCGHVLDARDLVPVVSYLCAHGRCRYCGAKLSSRHAWGEAISAAVFVSLLLKYDISLQTLEAWLLACVLLTCAFADLEGYIIPDRFLAAGIVLFIGDFFLRGATLERALDAALGGFGVAGAVLAIVLWTEKRMGREAMGGGDLKLLCLTGFFFGWKGNLFCLLLACLLGIGCGVAAERRHGRGTPIPWGPSIAAAAWGTALFAQPLIAWYLSLFW